MQNRPGHVQGRPRGKVQAVEQVMPGNDDGTQAEQRRAWQPHQQRQGEHADADGPDHLQVDHRGRQLERPGKVDQGELQRHQKQPALEQERRDIATALVLFAIQPGREPGQQHEHRRAQVRQGTAGEQCRLGGIDGHRVADLAVQEEGFAHVVQEHEQDYQTAQCVDALQALVELVGGGAGACHGGSLVKKSLNEMLCYIHMAMGR